MIKVTLTNDILKRITAIEQNRFAMNLVTIPTVTANKLRKNSKKKSSYASNKIEGNPLSEEQEIRNYFLALGLLEEKRKIKVPFSKELILEVQALVEKGASKEKIGLRGPMPPGVLFAVYDSETGEPDYIPPEHIDTQDLLAGLSYLNTKEKELLAFLIQKHLYEFTPIDVSKMLGVTNKTIINRCSKLAHNGFVIPIIVKERIRSYRFSDYTKVNGKDIVKEISDWQ